MPTEYKIACLPSNKSPVEISTVTSILASVRILIHVNAFWFTFDHTLNQLGVFIVTSIFFSEIRW